MWEVCSSWAGEYSLSRRARWVKHTLKRGGKAELIAIFQSLVGYMSTGSEGPGCGTVDGRTILLDWT